MARPRIDVVMPVRDAAGALDEALDSLLAQRSVDVRVIAVDDGSRDAGPAILAQWQARHANVVVRSTGGVGVARALAEGLAAAETPLVARMDADDISHPDRLAHQIERFGDDDGLAVVATQVEVFPAGQGEGLERYVAWQNAVITPEDHVRELFIESPICHPSVMMRRAAIARVGGYRNTAWPEDYDLWLRLDAAGYAMAKVEAPLLKWRRHAGQSTWSDARYAEARFIDAKAQHLAARLKRIAAGRRLVVWGAGPTGRRVARALERFGVRAGAFVDIDPAKIGRVARSVPILAPDALDRSRDFILVAVGARGARALIRAALRDHQCTETMDFLCAA